MGPILYLIYINDIGSNPITSNILIFTDDSVLIQTNSCLNDSCKYLELHLEVISNYFKSPKLGLNATKTKIMYFDKGFKRQSLSTLPNINLKGKNVDIVTSFKYLSVWIDSKLKFNIHLDAFIGNASYKLYMLSKIRICLDVRTATMIYKSMILLIIKYGNCFLLCCTLADKTHIQRIHNKGLKIAFKRDRLYNTKLLLKDARLASWEIRALIPATRLMFKNKFIRSNLDTARYGTKRTDF